jgi:hypothetical protein
VEKQRVVYNFQGLSYGVRVQSGEPEIIPVGWSVVGTKGGITLVLAQVK